MLAICLSIGNKLYNQLMQKQKMLVNTLFIVYDGIYSLKVCTDHF